MSIVPVSQVPGGIRIAVRVQPRSSRNAVAGLRGDALRVLLSVPPVDGRANEALIELLADRFGVSRTAIRIVSGGRSRNKLVEVVGVTPAEAVKLLS